MEPGREGPWSPGLFGRSPEGETRMRGLRSKTPSASFVVTDGASLSGQIQLPVNGRSQGAPVVACCPGGDLDASCLSTGGQS